MSKTLIMIRHGHRDTTRRELDNGLDDKGREHAKSLRRFFLERFPSEDWRRGLWIVSSPKVRCVETLQPLAKSVERSVDLHPDLTEQTSRESSSAFQARVRRFLEEWANSKPETTILCSHGDWLPLAAGILLGSPVDFKKGAWLEVEYESGHASVRWCVPSFKPFYK